MISIRRRTNKNLASSSDTNFGGGDEGMTVATLKGDIFNRYVYLPIALSHD